MGADLIIWIMPSFMMPASQVDAMMDKVRKHRTLILDLRGNHGGEAATLKQLVGHFFDRDLKIADRRGRREMEPLIARTRGNGVFKGKLVVLVDSDSASAAELFARVVQLEKRGSVVGDRTSGAVMESLPFRHDMGTGGQGISTKIFYGASITSADLLMSDGKSLERVGVVPDELMLPTAADLAAGRDPALARAVSLVGLAIDPEKAGKLFPED
jgi:carboxyl-terminal processing protease